MKKNITFLCYFISFILITVYICVFFQVFKNDFTYSYETYYIKAKTKYWYGYNGLQVKFGESFYYNGEDEIHLNGLQYMGKDFEFVKEDVDQDGRKDLIGVQITNSSTLFYEIPSTTDKYVIIIETESKENDLTFSLNNKKLETFTYQNGIYKLLVENAEKENILNIKSISNVNLHMLRFEEM